MSAAQRDPSCLLYTSRHGLAVAAGARRPAGALNHRDSGGLRNVNIRNLGALLLVAALSVGCKAEESAAPMAEPTVAVSEAPTEMCIRDRWVRRWR